MRVGMCASGKWAVLGAVQGVVTTVVIRLHVVNCTKNLLIMKYGKFYRKRVRLTEDNCLSVSRQISADRKKEITNSVLIFDVSTAGLCGATIIVLFPL